MSPPPPRPDDDDPPPPAAGWEVVEPARDPLLDDPLFAEIIEDKPLPDLKVEPPVTESVDDLPVAEVAPARAAPVERPRPVVPPAARPVTPPPPRRQDEPTEAPKPRVFAACAVLGCFGLGFVGAVAFIGWAALTLLSGIPDDRSRGSNTTAARPGPVRPTQMSGDSKQIPLPGRVHAVGRAAGGRYLLLHVQQTKQILVFDPNTGDLLNHRFECGPYGLFAGSASKLFVYRPDANKEEVQRFNLETGVLEKTAPRPPAVLAPTAMAAGAGVDGPVYLTLTPANAGGSVQAIDGETLTLADSLAAGHWQAAAVTHARASDDGMIWGTTTQNGATLLRIPQPPAKGQVTFLSLSRRGLPPPVLATPSPDGKLAYTPGGVVDLSTNPPKPYGNRSPYAFPTAHGSDLFLSVRAPAATAVTGPLRLHVAREPDLSEEFPTVEVPRGLRANDAGTLPPDQRIHVWPAAGIAVTIPPPVGADGQPDKQVLEVHRVDVPGILAKREDPYVVYGSEPQLWAVHGKQWRYRPVVWSKVEPAPKLELMDGPDQMEIQGGEVVWTPRGTVTQAEVRIRAATGELVTEQRFRLTVVDAHDDD